MQFSRPRRKIPTLGSLETAVLRHAWGTTTPIDAQGVHEAVAKGRVSLSTVQAALERLHRKGLLARAKNGRAYFYSAAISQGELIGALIGDLTQRLAAGELEPVISGFVDLVGDARPELLDRLGAAAAERRQAVAKTSWWTTRR